MVQSSRKYFNIAHIRQRSIQLLDRSKLDGFVDFLSPTFCIVSLALGFVFNSYCTIGLNCWSGTVIVIPNILMNRYGGTFIDDVLTILALSMIGGSARFLRSIRHWRSYQFRRRCHVRISVCVLMAGSMGCRPCL